MKRIHFSLLGRNEISKESKTMFPAVMNQQSIQPIMLNKLNEPVKQTSTTPSVPDSKVTEPTTLPIFDLTDADNVMDINELLIPPGRKTRPKK